MCSRRGAIYLNATPFWAFMPRPDAPGLAGRLIRRAVPYDGRMPAPAPLKAAIKALWWDRFTTKDTIRTVLRQVYHDRCAPSLDRSLPHIDVVQTYQNSRCLFKCSMLSLRHVKRAWFWGVPRLQVCFSLRVNTCLFSITVQPAAQLGLLQVATGSAEHLTEA